MAIPRTLLSQSTMSLLCIRTKERHAPAKTVSDTNPDSALEKHIPVRLDRNHAIGFGVLWDGCNLVPGDNLDFSNVVFTPARSHPDEC
jgi:hypothetical protein